MTYINKDMSCSQISRSNTERWRFFPNCHTGLTTVAIKIQASVFGNIKVTVKFMLQHKGTRIAEPILRKKNRLGRPRPPGCDDHSSARAIEASWYRQKDRRQSANRPMLGRTRKPPGHPHRPGPLESKKVQSEATEHRQLLQRMTLEQLDSHSQR